MSPSPFVDRAECGRGEAEFFARRKFINFIKIPLRSGDFYVILIMYNYFSEATSDKDITLR